MLHNILNFFREDVVRTTVTAVISALSALVAAYIQWRVVRLAKRDHHWELRFREKVGPWLDMAQRTYFKERFWRKPE
jgi:hypothetical protein